MSRFKQMSAREWDVVEQLLQGKSNKLIAASLNISVSTVEFHLQNIYEKVNVSSRLELILKLWKATGKANIEELGYSPVDSMEEWFENEERQATHRYRRIQKIMRFYRIVLGICLIAILLPLALLAIHVIRRPDSIIIWRGILIWLLPAAAILILLVLFPRLKFRPLVILAGILLLALLGIGVVTYIHIDYFLSPYSLLVSLFPYLIGAAGVLIASKYRSRETDPGPPNTE